MTTYSGDNATGAITTNYFYNWYTNSSGDQTNNPEAVVTIQPAVAAGQNDTGVNSVEIEWMDQQGNVESAARRQWTIHVQRVRLIRQHTEHVRLVQ